MTSNNKLGLSNLNITYLYYLLILIKTISNEEFIDLKSLPILNIKNFR